ncbi:MAG: hypothetical protein Q9195_003967 [Heterodermia aff. obscurata]
MGCAGSRGAKQGPPHLASASYAPLLHASAADARQDMKSISDEDIVFSCCVCHKTLSEIYDDDDDESGQHPKAPCPFCKEDKGDDTPRFLLGISGKGPSDHDPQIPQAYFDIPATRLKEEDPEAAALRFHYVSIIRFAKAAYEQKRQAEKELAELKFVQEQDRKQWTLRMVKMQQLGQAMTNVQSQLKRARDWLCNLGQDVSSIDDALSYRSTGSGYQHIGVFDDSTSSYSGEISGRLEQERTAASTQRFEGPLRLARGSAADLERMTRDKRSMASSTLQQLNTVHAGPSTLHSLSMPHFQAPEQSSSSKRKRTDTDTDISTGRRMKSRDAMPPPQLPPRRLPQYEPEFGIFHMSMSPPRFHHAPFPSGGDTLAPPAPSRNASESPATATGHISPLETLNHNDGELDTMRYHQPTPQRPIHRPSSVSPVRQRLTLTPRSSAQGRPIGPGLLSHARSSSSSAASFMTPRSSSTTTASHRQQLGQSRYFTPRELPATPRFRGSEADAGIVNGLSFIEDPAVGSTGGRRMARR